MTINATFTSLMSSMPSHSLCYAKLVQHRFVTSLILNFSEKMFCFCNVNLNNFESFKYQNKFWRNTRVHYTYFSNPSFVRYILYFVVSQASSTRYSTISWPMPACAASLADYKVKYISHKWRNGKISGVLPFINRSKDDNIWEMNAATHENFNNVCPLFSDS